ncbi:MAG: CBS domain-containing protein, partial [Deltaproteobacteria bacterium]
MSKIITHPFEPSFEISDKDVKEAMQEIPGYIDITPGDFVELYKVALVHALRRLRRILRAKDIMTTRVLTVLPGTPLNEVASTMAAEKISGLPVVDGNSHPVGMISEADFLTRMASDSHAGFMGVIAQCLSGKQCLAVPVRG